MHVERNILVLVVTFMVAGCSSHLIMDRQADEVAKHDRGSCEITEGSGSGTIIVGNLVVDGQATASALYMSQGIILAVATEAQLSAQYPDATFLRCQNSIVSPGFINAHEHTRFSYTAPQSEIKPYYVHRDEWRRALNNKDKIDPPDSNDPAVLAWIELRHLLSGVTTLAGSGGVVGFVNNASSSVEPAYTYQVDSATFPFGYEAMDSFGAFPCNSDPENLPAPKLSGGVPTTVAFVPHVGEGTHCTADLEIDAYLHYVHGAPARRYSLIHGIGIGSRHVTELKEHDVTVIWSPRSNVALYGATLDGTWLLDQGVRVALGTDWSPSGSFNVFEEIRCAMVQSQNKSRPLAGAEAWRMVTDNPAYALGIETRTGALEPGKAADIVIFDGISSNSLDDFGALSPENVIAVFVGGDLLAVDSRHLRGTTLEQRCPNNVGTKRLCMDFSEYPFDFSDLLIANAKHIGLLDVHSQASCEVSSDSE